MIRKLLRVAPTAILVATAARQGTAQTPHRAILLSIDSFNEQRLLSSLDRERTPALHALFNEGACADWARTNFPSVTAAAHASLWTGAYGDVSGIAANDIPRLPRDQHTLLDNVSGFLVPDLRAEPIWITAARAGLPVVAHHPTQAPQAPGYPPVDSRDESDSLAKMRADAAALLARPSVRVLNGYNRTYAPAAVLTERSNPPRAASGWRGLERLAANAPTPREIAWRYGNDSLFALFTGEAGRYTKAIVATTRDVTRGVTVTAAQVERDTARNRPLARFFSAPLVTPIDGGRVYLSFRLFDLAPDGSRYTLFHPVTNVVETNRPEVQADYLAAIGGWIGNSAYVLYDRNAFGNTVARGGDGTAEARYLETAELLTRQYIRGSEWLWRTAQPTLQVEYFPLGDDVDHKMYGFVAAGTPGVDPLIAARVQEWRARLWALVDLRFATLRDLARASGAALFVSGDHGMRAAWRVFRPNVALVAGGLLATDSAGRIDLSRTRALSSNGYWVSVNRINRKGGIVAPETEWATLDAAERALLAARGTDGAPIVTRIWRAAEHDSLGLGGPTGGDLYYDLAPGYKWTSQATGPLTSAAEPTGEHGYPSVLPEMRTVLCALGPTFPAHRIGPARTIDVAPTIAEWLGIPAPAQSQGRSVLSALSDRPGNRTRR